MERVMDKEPIDSSPLSTWSRRLGVRGKMGDPAKTVKKIGEQRVAKYITQLAEASHNYKTQYMHSEWARNILAVYGLQHIERDADGRWHPIALGEDEKHTSNLMLKSAFALASSFLGASPDWAVVPASGDSEDVIKARTAEKILRAIYHEHKVFVRRLFAILDMVIMSDGFLKLCFNPMGGQVMKKEMPIVDGLGQPVIDPETGQLAANVSYGIEGDLEIYAPSPFHIHVPPGTKTPLMNDCDWVIEKAPISLAQIWARYRYEAKPDTTASDPAYELASDFSRAIGAKLENYYVDTRAKDEAFVYEYHELAKLQEGYEEGIVIKVVNDEIVSVTPQPLPHRAGYQYVHLPQLPMHNRFWSHSVMTEVWPAQKMYNKDRLRLSQNRDLTALPWIWDPHGSGIPQDALTSGPRRLRGVTEPKWISPPSLSQALVADLSESLADMDRIANQFGPARGELPGKSPLANQALEFLQQAENQTRQPQLALSSDAWIDFGYKALETVRRFYPEGRLFAMAGPTARVEGFMAGAQQIPLRYEILVQADSALVQSKTQLRQELMQGIQVGLYADAMQDPQKLQWLRDQLRYPTPGDLTPPQMLDHENAVMEWQRFLTEGTPPEVSPLEDLSVHIEDHVRVTKTEGYKRLPTEMRKTWVEHIQQTQALLQSQQAAGTQAGFEQQTMSALLEAVSRGKFRDAEALLLAMRGIMERLQMEVQASQGAVQGGGNGRGGTPTDDSGGAGPTS